MDKHTGSAEEMWASIQKDALVVAHAEPALASTLQRSVIAHQSYAKGLGALLADNLMSADSRAESLPDLIAEAIERDGTLVPYSLADLEAIQARDPACTSSIEAFLFYRGFKALQSYRVAHYYWAHGRRMVARYLQSLILDRYSMDLHPAAHIEGGIFIDHGTGIVIGETARVERNVSILHNVTLGGTGKTTGVRHPKICEGVLLGAGSKILGNITVGKNSKVAAGSIVLKDVPENTTAVGIPARLIHKDQGEIPAYDMEQKIEDEP